jgi:hypothetical protein
MSSRAAAVTSALAVSGALLALSEPVGAATPTAAAPEKVVLRYVGEPGCPSEAELVDEIKARVRRPIQWGASDASIQIVITVHQGGGQASGELEVQRRSTDATRREFTASSCAEVGSALALVAALALDPNARTEPLPARASGSQPGETPASSAVSAAAPADEHPLPAAPSTVPAPSPAAPPRAAPTSYLVWLGPTANIAAGYAPKVLGLVGLSLGARLRTQELFSPGLQLTPLWGKTGSTGPSAPSGSFAWALARLEACPTPVRLAAPLVLDPCVAGEVGRLTARGADGVIDVPVTAERWWASAGATLSLHLSGRFWFARLGGLALFPATRDEFVFHDPDRSIHKAGVVVWGASLAAGFQLGD